MHFKWCAALCTISISATALAQSGLPYSIEPPEGSVEFGRTVASGGDVDGDGLPDIFVADPGFRVGIDMVGRWSVYRGVDGTLIWSVTGDQPYFSDPSWPPTITGAFIGDIDGDQRDDLIVGVREADELRGRATVYSGRTGAVLYDYFGREPEDRLGVDVHGLGDISGDQVPDFAFVGRYAEVGYVALCSGATGEEIRRFVPNSPTRPRRIRSAGDLDGDRVPDVLIATSGGGNGGASWGELFALSGAKGDVLWHAVEGSNFGWSSATGVDLTGDDIPDVVAWRHSPDQLMLVSGATGRVVATLAAPLNTEYWGCTLAYADSNGDGRLEIASARLNVEGIGIDIINPVTERNLHWTLGFRGMLRTFPTGNEMAIADVNGDGADDFVIASFGKGVRVFGGSPLLLNFAQRRDNYNITPGQPYDLTVGGGQPGRVVHLLGSITGNGCTFIQQLGLCIDLDRRLYNLGHATTDAQRIAHFTITIPPNTPRGPIWLQAIDPNDSARGPITSDVLQLEIVD